MSHYAPAPQKPDGRIFASYPMPAKIDLINERPRRESLIEQQLEHKIGEPILPKIEISFEQRPAGSSITTSERHVVSFNHHDSNNHDSTSSAQYNYPLSNVNETRQQAQTTSIGRQQQQQQYPQQFKVNQQQQMVQQQQQHQYPQQLPGGQSVTTTQTTTNINRTIASNNAANLAAELAEKEAKLMAEIEALHKRPYSPFQTPAKIDLTNEQKKAQLQADHAPAPRSVSRTSSNRSTSADLLDKEAKLLQEIEEIEKKPYNPQTMVVEREQWYEYPQNRPHERHMTDSKRRVKDFCSLPSHMYEGQERHIHEENPVSRQGQLGSASPSSIHTTIIRSPKREVDNKSPLPFAFDNFTTKGVRGNIASVGAIEPDRPRAPIYPIIKRSPSPNLAR